MADGDDAPPGAPVAPAGHVILVGLPGAGKSTVGRRVARRLGHPFLDLDVEIERRAGRSVAAIFAAEGEAGFRAREAALSAELARAGAMAGRGSSCCSSVEDAEVLSGCFHIFIAAT